MIIRQSRVLYRLLQDQFHGKIWLVEAEENDKKFIEDMFFPTKILSINSVWVPGGLRFPINTETVIQIVKNARNLDIEIEFENKRA
jgi:transcription antitermination factor NusA-like protein